MQPELGIIEGFYGPSWTWDDRKRLVSRLAPHGYGFYLYAPKLDQTLRNRWRDPFTADETQALADFSAYCRTAGVRFGVGLSPVGAVSDFGPSSRDALQRKLMCLDELGIKELALLFDDVRNDFPDLAARQADLAHWARDRTRAERMILCPSYYADDPMLDALFGPRPDQYLEQLGMGLETHIDIFWAGKEVCSSEISPDHLQDITARLQRKPFLWDNYPVNDGQRMCGHLHLRGFSGRSAAIGQYITAHGINPALQPALSCIPALTLESLYREGEAYREDVATQQAMIGLLGERLATLVYEDLPLLQDLGLEALTHDKHRLRRRYQAFEHPCAREIVAWLDGAYQMSEDVVPTQ